MKQRMKKATRFFEMAVDYGICIYLVAVIVCLPFYFTNGYAHIGTDKAMFFRGLNWYLGRVLLLAVGIFLILKLVNFLQAKNEKNKKKKKHMPEKKKGIQGNITDIFFLIYGAALLISYACSNYKEAAWLGAAGWYMGLFTQLAFVLTYFIVSRLWKPRAWMFYLMLPVSAVVFLLGFLDRLGLYTLEMESRNNAFISTIGNINWYCSYVVTVLFLGAMLWWKNENLTLWQRRFLMAYTALGFATLLTQGSESGGLTVVVVMLVLFCMSAGDGKKMVLFWQEVTMMSVGCFAAWLLGLLRGDKIAVIEGWIYEIVARSGLSVVMTIVSGACLFLVTKWVKTGKYPEKQGKVLGKVIAVVSGGSVLLAAVLIILNTVWPGSIGPLSKNSFFTFSRTWGSSRGATWGAAMQCFAEQNFLHKLVGVGPDAMSAFFYSDASVGLQTMLAECFGTAALTNAHNEWLTVLADVGILGLVGFAGGMISAILRFFKAKDKSGLLFAVGFCLLGYTVNNIFSFQQTINGATMFVILGMAEAFWRDGNSEPEISTSRRKKR